jgi:hypothetical protein
MHVASPRLAACASLPSTAGNDVLFIPPGIIFLASETAGLCGLALHA